MSESIARVLAEHASTKIVYVPVPRRPEIRQLTYVCSCGVTLLPAVTKGEAHRAHVTEALADLVTAARAEERERLAADPCHRAEGADHCPTCPGPVIPPLPKGMAADPYCPWHGSRATAYSDCSCDRAGLTKAVNREADQ